ADVGAGVAVLGGGLALGGSDQRAGEPVDLGAVVVEVVLAGDRRALGAQQPAQRVAHSGPARAADVDRAGRVGRHEFQVDVLGCQFGGVPVLGAGLQHVGHHDALCGGVDAQVDETGAGDLGGGDPVHVGERGGQPAGQFARVDPHLLPE